jgi:hypothetical protein
MRPVCPWMGIRLGRCSDEAGFVPGTLLTWANVVRIEDDLVLGHLFRFLFCSVLGGPRREGSVESRVRLKVRNPEANDTQLSVRERASSSTKDMKSLGATTHEYSRVPC